MPQIKAWSALGANAPYPCKAKLIGETLPGRRGGTITACATPSPKRPREGQYWVGFPVQGFGHPVRKSTAARRIRTRHIKREITPIEQVAAAVEFTRADHIPVPIGVEFPILPGSSRCSPKHPLWGDRYREAVEDARAEAAERVSEDATAEEYEAAAAAIFRQRTQALAKRLQRTEDDCVRAFEARQEKRRGKAVESTHREAARLRQRAAFAGVDLGSAEYRDAMRGGEGAKKRKR